MHRGLLLGAGGSSGGSPPPSTAEKAPVGFGFPTTSVSLGPAATRYVPLGAVHTDRGTSKAAVAYPWRGAGTFRKFRLRATSNTLSGATTITVCIGASEPLSFTLAAGATTASETSTDVSVTATDAVCIKIATAAGTGSVTIRSLTAEFETSGQVFTHLCGLSVSGVAGSTSVRYVPPMGQAVVGSNESSSRLKAIEACTISNLFADLVDANTSDTTNVRSRKNGANGGQLVSFAASASALTEDTSGSDTLAAGDYFAVQKDTTGEAAAIGLAGFKYTGQVAGRSMGGCAGSANASASTTYYCGLFGQVLGTTTEANAQQEMPFAGRISHLTVTTGVTFSSTTNLVVTLRVNGASQTAVQVSANAANTTFSATGYFDVSEGDLISFQFTGQDNTVTVNSMQYLVTDAAHA